MQDAIKHDYFEWLIEVVCGERYAKTISYRMLLGHLHAAEFTYIIPNDLNRAKDGIALRYRYSLLQGWDTVPECLDGPCSVLEMMVALSLSCEENIMDDPEFGNRTSQWFWSMIANLGLGYMTDDKYDDVYVEECIQRLLSRDYDPDGKGGLFRIKNCRHDLRTIEIWYQLCWYLNTIS